MRLTHEQPIESVTERNGEIRMVEYPGHDVPNTYYLINEPGSVVYTEPGSGGELFKIETLLMRGPENGPENGPE